MEQYKTAVFFAVVILVSAKPSSPDNPEAKRLIKFSEEEPATLLSQEEIRQILDQNIKFMDITDHPNPDRAQLETNFVIPTRLRFGSKVASAIKLINKERMKSFVKRFSAFHTRYYLSATGVDASNWLLDQVKATIASSIVYKGRIRVKPFNHTWPQNSVIARIKGTDPTLANQVLVLGAHLDSICEGSGTAAGPGADDNGTGTVTLLETLRTLLESKFIPKRTIEFHWYAAEEVGLRGSQAIVDKYKNNGVEVVAVANFDMTGFMSNKPKIAIITDYTDEGLNEFTRLVIDGYLDYPWVNQICGYGCSDHASWNRRGYKATHPFEDSMNPNLHSSRDKVEFVNFDHVAEFTKLAIGFAVEIGEPQNAGEIV